MEVICLQDGAFYALVEEVVQRMKEKLEIKEDKWISDKEAMHKLRIQSKSTLQEMRNNGEISFSQPKRKVILYDAASIDEYLEKHRKNTF
jgi:hypothetical protein